MICTFFFLSNFSVLFQLIFSWHHPLKSIEKLLEKQLCKKTVIIMNGLYQLKISWFSRIRGKNVWSYSESNWWKVEEIIIIIENNISQVFLQKSVEYNGVPELIFAEGVKWRDLSTAMKYRLIILKKSLLCTILWKNLTDLNCHWKYLIKWKKRLCENYQPIQSQGFHYKFIWKFIYVIYFRV